jgi:hypothetical protein
MSNRTRKSRKLDNAQHTGELTTYLARRGPGDEDFAPTPERLRRARDGDQKITPTIIHTEAGFPTGQFYWRITPVIDELEKRGTLTNEEWTAATRYMRYYAGSRHKGPATSKLMPYYDRGFQSLDPAERAVAMGQARSQAEKAVHPFFRPSLRWLEAAAEDEWPLWRLGEMYYPHLSRSAQSAKASVVLHFTLAMLADHFGIGHRFSTTDIEYAVRTMRVTVEIEQTVIHRRQKVL